MSQNRRPTTKASFEERIEAGRVFTVRRHATGNNDGTAINLVVTNPANSGVNLLTVAPTFQASAEAFARKHQGVTIDTNGTSITPRNKKIGNPRTAEANAEHSGTYSGGTSRGTEVVGSSSGGGGAGGSIGKVDLALEIPPDNTVRYELESDASGNDMSIVLTWTEEKL